MSTGNEETKPDDVLTAGAADRGSDSPVTWRRLDPRMLLIYPIEQIRGFLPVILIALLTGKGEADAWWQYVAVALPILAGVYRYVVTRYRITGEQIELRTGIISRSTTTARMDRIRTVDVTTPFIHRLLGVAKVEIGTGGQSSLELNSLPAEEARHLRDAFLTRGTGTATPTGDDAAQVNTTDPGEVLVELDLRWTRYALATLSGPVVIVGAFAVLNRYLGDALDQFFESSNMEHRVETLPIALAVTGAAIIVLLLWLVVSIGGYVVANWGFLVTRDRDHGRIHVRRGLFTTAETSLDTARIRGIEIAEPLGLRTVRGGRLDVLVTAAGVLEGGSTLVVPPAPRAVVDRAAADLLGDPDALTISLQRHGPVARRRILLRALRWTAIPIAAVFIGAAYAGVAVGWSITAALVLAGAATVIALNRYARLGHALTPEHLVRREGSLLGSTVALDTAGIIGWRFSQSFFQRRSGVMDLWAVTAAGAGSYTCDEIPLDRGVEISVRAVPGLVEQFLDEPVRSTS